MRVPGRVQKIGDALVRRFAPASDDRRWLVRRFYDFTGRWPNLEEPRTYLEKLLWLNLYHRDPLIPILADKFLARAEVARRVGHGVLNELLGVWDDPEQIPFEQLPDGFVLKGTAGSGQNVFCWDRSRFDVSAAKAQARLWLDEDYYGRYREWCYRTLTRRIIAEPLMRSDCGHDRSPDDLKIHCFNGQPRYIKFCTDRRGSLRYECFDPQWNVLDLGLVAAGKRCDTPPPPPSGLDHLLDVATKLSAGFPYVRVDLYRHKGRTVFGEMTWFPHAGNVPIADPHLDRMMGDWIQLPLLREETAFGRVEVRARPTAAKRTASSATLPPAANPAR